VRPFPKVDGGRWQVLDRWWKNGTLVARDGQELFYISPEQALMGVRL
jgi:hypothetical protein